LLIDNDSIQNLEEGGVKMRLRIMVVGILILASTMTAGCTPGDQAQGSYIDISPAEAKQLIDENPDLVVIDVSPVYAAGHLAGAVNYYLGDGSLDAATPMLDKNATYLVYCHAESASRQGAQKLVDAGFTNVYRLEGEYDAWVDAGYPIET
jgi:rhodanese-related sulfurtransferase